MRRNAIFTRSGVVAARGCLFGSLTSLLIRQNLFETRSPDEAVVEGATEYSAAVVVVPAFYSLFANCTRDTVLDRKDRPPTQPVDCLWQGAALRPLIVGYYRAIQNQSG